MVLPAGAVCRCWSGPFFFSVPQEQYGLSVKAVECEHQVDIDCATKGECGKNDYATNDYATALSVLFVVLPMLVMAMFVVLLLMLIMTVVTH